MGHADGPLRAAGRNRAGHRLHVLKSLGGQSRRRWRCRRQMARRWSAGGWARRAAPASTPTRRRQVEARKGDKPNVNHELASILTPGLRRRRRPRPTCKLAARAADGERGGRAARRGRHRLVRHGRPGHRLRHGVAPFRGGLAISPTRSAPTRWWSSSTSWPRSTARFRPAGGAEAVAAGRRPMSDRRGLHRMARAGTGFRLAEN